MIKLFPTLCAIGFILCLLSIGYYGEEQFFGRRGRRCPRLATPMANFSLSQFEGEWFEIARLPNRFERGICQSVSFSQIQQENSTKVKVAIVAKEYRNGELVSSNSTAKVKSSNNAKWVVKTKVTRRFFHRHITYTIKTPISILDTDYSNYAVLWSCKNRRRRRRGCHGRRRKRRHCRRRRRYRDDDDDDNQSRKRRRRRHRWFSKRRYAWILGRQKTLSDQSLTEILNKLKAMGIKTRRFKFATQEYCTVRPSDND
ncbi:hypothetical protein C9374_010760 [Naegleria lovaniensis]|uniref:Lipocalin/cytosolic fatty-acid binding domain-containing protein n=1 Tax=Naegleria lovaniensis TaxID=51637 RepID=A0AA88GHZ2_NAELO|nr:uncharacterized protein C9374_010760 [Naegleria lovaniensis]KAG2374476.1 hypothetical protein C9374_010760 [Naegleria lovaniensis]